MSLFAQSFNKSSARLGVFVRLTDMFLSIRGVDEMRRPYISYQFHYHYEEHRSEYLTMTVSEEFNSHWKLLNKLCFNELKNKNLAYYLLRLI